MLKKLAPYLSIIFVDAFGFGLAYPVLAALFTSPDAGHLLLDTSQASRHFAISLTFMLYPLGLLFGAAWLGDSSDRFGQSNILKLSMAGLGLGFLLTALGITLSSMLVLCIGRFLSGFMAGSQAIAQAAVAQVQTSQPKAHRLSIAALFMSMGMMIGPLSGGVLTSAMTYSIPFYTATLFAILALVWILKTNTTDHKPSQLNRIDWLRPITALIQAFQHTQVRVIAFSFLLMQIGFSAYFQFIILHMKYIHHYAAYQLGTFQAILGFGFALGLLVGIPATIKRFKVRHITSTCLLLTGLGQIVASLIHDPALQWPLALIIAIVDIMALASVFTLLSDAVTKQQQGWAMGIGSTVIAVSWITSALSANLLSTLGTQGLIFTGGILLLVASGSLSLFLQESIKAK